MANRHLLHTSKKADFEQWLVEDGWVLQNTKGFWEVIRAKKGHRILLVYRKDNAKEHLSVEDKDVDVVKAFLNSQQENKTNRDTTELDEIQKLRNENEVLKNRCFALSGCGQMCFFCKMECKHKSM